MILKHLMAILLYSRYQYWQEANYCKKIGLLYYSRKMIHM